jgi:CrcB protein
MRGALQRMVAALLWVALGAIPGALLRWSLANLLVANTLGCFVVGGAGLMGSPSTRRTLVVGIGFAGALTSFSTWVLALLALLQRGQWADVLLLVLRDGLLGVAALRLGMVAHRRWQARGRRLVRWCAATGWRPWLRR